MHEVLCSAIHSRDVIAILYKAHRREVEPHAVGYDGHGRLILSAWQLSGGSGEDWRDYFVSEILEISATNQRFEIARAGFNPGKRLVRIVCSVR